MDEKKFLADEFEANRAHLKTVAYRMLGSRAEAEDAVQEAWLRLGRSDTSEVGNLGGWLTTVVARICLDMLRSRKSRREEPLDPPVHEKIADTAKSADPEREIVLADSVGVALLVVLEQLAPAERVAFVLHDMFDLPFDEIAPVIGRTPEATRQLASRARRRVQGTTEAPEAGIEHKKEVVRAFLAASRDGNFQALLAVLHPDVVFAPDATAARFGHAGALHGAQAVATTFNGRARGALPAFVDGGFGFIVRIQDQLRIVVKIGFDGEKIATIEAIANPDHIERIEYRLFDR
ncbi:sigma-70 family RNA polymerase sigma factor [Rhizobium mongolense]|uniref:sigma-70 family RNA polymerase sigma factor n=1 Tax=Rhizobium TaxID=379 RepID=UPI0024B16D03|nr:sigma-70 family RNA polymerase sigma factor [Rhizobium sp. CC1099]WFU91614.1 sigma-70 family RNA polymerase sigma factor [Rhizobium sp. CC1099]